MGKRSKQRNGIERSGFDTGAMQVARKIAGNASVQLGDRLPEEEKISHALQTLLKMETSEDMPPTYIEEMLDYVVIAWNISTFPAEKQEGMIKKVVDDALPTDGAELQEDMTRSLKKMIFTKNVLYPDDKRFVVDCKMRVCNSRLFVSAAAIRVPVEESAPI